MNQRAIAYIERLAPMFDLGCACYWVALALAHLLAEEDAVVQVSNRVIAARAGELMGKGKPLSQRCIRNNLRRLELLGLFHTEYCTHIDGLTASRYHFLPFGTPVLDPLQQERVLARGLLLQAKAQTATRQARLQVLDHTLRDLNPEELQQVTLFWKDHQQDHRAPDARRA